MKTKTVIVIITSLILASLIGCVFGGSSVFRTFKRPTDRYEKAFTYAIRAMNDVGKVTSSDKEAGYVNGTSDSGVDLIVTIIEQPKDGVKLDVKATVPAGKFGLGKITEAEEFLSS